jgi:NitT/TauT family transport system permease protein
VWVLLLGLWEGAYRSIGWRAYVFPAPSQVLDATLHLLNVPTGFGETLHAGWPWKPAPESGVRPDAAGDVLHSALPSAVATSLARLGVGFSLSLLMGGVLGLLMWRYSFWNALCGPVFLGLQTLPSVCWAPLAILLFGLNERGIVFVMMMGSFFAIAIALRDGLRQTPPIYKRAAQMLGARHWSMYRYVLLPAGLPAAASSLRQGFAFAWRSLMGGEFVLQLTRQGLGLRLSTARDFNNVAQVMAIMTVMVLIGTVVDRFLFARLEQRVRTRFGLI